MLGLPFLNRRRSPSDAEIARELRDHLELDSEAMVAAGEAPRDAHLHARRQFGNVAMIYEETREVWGRLWLERLRQDFQFGVRMLIRSPIFSRSPSFVSRSVSERTRQF